MSATPATPAGGDVTTTVECPHCRHRVADARFCTHCGRPLASGRAGAAADDMPGDQAADRSSGAAVTDAPAAVGVVACVRCGGVNAVSRDRCGRCGHDLTGHGAADTGRASGRRVTGTDAAASADDGPGLPGMLVILTVILLAVSAAVVLTLLSARGVGPFAGPDSGELSVTGAGTVEIADVRASSALAPEADITYDADNLVDDDPSTAWNEGEPGDGEGVWIDVELAQPTVVTSVIVWNGYQAGDFFAQHNRVRRLRLELDGRMFAVRLLDRRGAQAITLPERIATGRIRLTVAGTFPGTVYNDTALSELSVRGVPQDPSATAPE